MSLIQRVTALAQAVAADIKALYTGKAEKEHTHTKSDVGLSNVDNTRDLDKTVGRFTIRDTRHVVSVPDNVPQQSGLFEFKNLSSVGTPPKPSSPHYAHVLTTNGWTADGTGGWPTQISLGAALSFRKGTGKKTWGQWYELISTNTMLGATGQSTLYPMTQKAVTDAINARGFADASGILTATSGALSNDMSSYLSSKTYAEMRTKLGVVPVNVVQDTGTSTTAVMSQKAVTEAIAAAGGGSSGSVNVVQKDGLSASAVMSQYAVSIALYDVSTLVNISRTYCLEQHAALHALNPATATLPQLITALQSATLLDYEEYLPPPEP